MIKKTFWSTLLIFFFLFVASSFYILSSSETIQFSQEQAVYELPYPGILPDHPLYFVKAMRDRIQIFATREYLQKAELYILLSDKRVAMARDLVKKGKIKLALVTCSKGEKYLFKTPFLFKESKKQGTGASTELIEKAKQSNQKHKEIIEKFLQELPQGYTDEIRAIMKINDETKQELSSL